MKIIALFIGADILLLGVACYCFESLYYGSYEHAVCVSERRLPLWYPYEICEMCKPVGQAELHDWRDYSTSDVEWEGQLSEPIEEDYARALSAVQEIVDFNVGSNVVCGLRKLKRFNPAGYPQGESFGERYFLFATNMTAARYFKSESDFLAECRRYGIKGTERGSFHLNYGLFNRNATEYDTAISANDRSFEHARKTTGLRLPLWYPYEILKREDEFGGTLELHDWRKYCCAETNTFSPAAAEVEKALLALSNIVEFKIHRNCVCGRRELRSRMLPVSSVDVGFGERYFLFATNMPAAQYFSRESDYLAECKRFGIDGRDLNDFDTNHRAFVRKEAQTTFRGRIEFALGHGKAGGRWLKLWIGILLGANIVGIFLCNLGAKYNAVRLDKWK